MEICKNCRLLFDPSVVPGHRDKFVDDFLCSWHSGDAEHVGNTGPRGAYADVYRWTCCGQTHVGAVIRGRDYPPRRSPGCKRGHHVADPQLAVDPHLAQELEALQERLREIEAREFSGRTGRGVFISYSHRDCAFVDQLAQRLHADEITYWRDEKDILVGEVIDRAISRGIQAHSLFLIVLSPYSINSGWVQRELDEAAHEETEGRKILLPVLANGLPADIPARLRRFKCADFNSDFDRAYSLLVRSVIAHLQRKQGKQA